MAGIVSSIAVYMMITCFQVLFASNSARERVLDFLGEQSIRGCQIFPIRLKWMPQTAKHD